ncbi:MAG: hypothetical protein KGO53_13100 [Alphaproteobacteria bacterium]|nr:hypothetical protein [Alphaproteobacteria bacterium]
MIRYTLFLATILGTAATAVASVMPASHILVDDPTAVTVVYKTELATIAPHHTVLVKCAVEDCSDTPQ